MITSYAQNLEDVMLWRALGHIERGCYIDLGAQDPIADSVSLAFYEHGWRGIHVEPTPYYADLLRLNRPDETVIQAAVGEAAGLTSFFEFPNTGLSTGNSGMASQHVERGFAGREIVVPRITLDEVLALAPAGLVHWLKIDVEGEERRVLEGWRGAHPLPWLIVIESFLPLTQTDCHEQWEYLLLAKGYQFVFFDGLNRFYVSDSHLDLMGAFKSGPNVFDCYVLSGKSTSSPSSALNAQIKSLATERDHVKSELQSLATERDHVKSELQSVATERDHVKSELQSVATERDHVKSELQSVVTERDHVKSELQSSEVERNQSLADLASVRTNLDDTDARLKALVIERNQRSEQLSLLKAQHDSAVEEYVAQIGELRRGQLELEQINESTAQQLRVLNERLHASQSANLEFSRQLLVTTLHVRDAKDQLALVEQTARQQRLESASALEQTIGLYSDQMQQAHAKISSLENDIANRDDRIGGLVSRVSELDGNLNEQIGAQRALRESLSWRATAIFRVAGRWFATQGKTKTGARTGMDTQGPSAINPHSQSLDELLSLDDEDFVRDTYRVLLQREADKNGLAHYLAAIRAGEPRIAVLRHIRQSEEGRKLDCRVDNLDDVIRAYRFSRIPLVGAFVTLTSASLRRANKSLSPSALDARLGVVARSLAESESVKITTPLVSTSAATPAGSPSVTPSATPAVSPPLIAIVRRPESPPTARIQLADAVVATPNDVRLSSQATLPEMRLELSPLTWFFDRQTGESPDENRVILELPQALSRLGHHVEESLTSKVEVHFSLHPTEHPGTAVSIVWQDWGESGYAMQTVAAINKGAGGVGCASRHAAKILVDHGVTAPIAVIGMGVDHWLGIQPSRVYRTPGKRFRFLHVSECDSGSGVDVLMEAFGRVFDSEDDVSLIIYCTGGSIDWHRQTTKLREQAIGSCITVIDTRLSSEELQALYAQCNVFVWPNRASGFGQEVARAFLSGMSVVATAWGGHADYCNSSNSWLIDFDFQRSKSDLDLPISAWAEPSEAHLEHILWTAYSSSLQQRTDASKRGRDELLNHFSWSSVALRASTLANQVVRNLQQE